MQPADAQLGMQHSRQARLVEMPRLKVIGEGQSRACELRSLPMLKWLQACLHFSSLGILQAANGKQQCLQAC